MTRLESRDPKSAEAARRLADEHRTLAQLTEQLAGTVDRMLADDIVSRDAFRAETDAFIQAYWRHMAFEEDEFFPAARRALTDADWDAIAAEMTDPEDPVFDDTTAERYWRLRYEIVEADGAS